VNKYDRTALLSIVFILWLSQSVLAAASPVTSVALVLGGGAARGFSHIGLIQAFEENGIPIHMLVGTSMGSIVSSLYAAGYSVDNMKTIVANLDSANLVDVIFPPRGGLIGTERLKRYLDVLLMHKSFDELEIPFYSVITELQTGREVAMHQGNVAVAVQASMSIPALFPPVEIDGTYFVDGGMKNAVPANVAQAHGANVIIGVDVKKELKDIDFDSILNDIQLTMWFMIGGYVELNTKAADVIIVPDVKYDSYMDYQKAEFFIEQGYRAGLQYLDQIKAAVLEVDPDFEFVPYTQSGLSDSELEAVMKEAERAALEAYRPFGLMPELAFSDDNAPKLGLRIQYGRLGWFRIGYRYGLSTDLGGHEMFVGWHKPHVAETEFFVRHSGDQPNVGIKASLPLGDHLRLGAAYQVNGTYLWQVHLSHANIFNSRNFCLGSSAVLTQHAAESGQPLMAGFNSNLKIYFREEYDSLFEVTLARPYLYGQFSMATPVNQLQAAVEYQVGIGTELKLFGLYPLDLHFGVDFGSDSGPSWRLGFAKGDY